MKLFFRVCLGLLAGLSASSLSAAGLPVVDLSANTARQVVVAQGTEKIYQGHPTTVLLPDGRTMFATWTLGHGGVCGPMKRSDDGGRTWSELLPTPANWAEVKNCPSLYRLTDPKGVTRLFVFAGNGPDHKMQQAHSTDDGKTWTPMSSVGLECVMPFCTIAPVDGGKRLIGLTSIRRPGETKDKRSNILVQSESTDGGLSWSAWRILLDLGDLKPCEPAVLRSPDGKQLLCLIRENDRKTGSHYMTSDDEGRTWSKEKSLPTGLWGDRHMPHYAADGRLVVCFRDMGPDKSTHNHFAAWVGRYEDILQGREGQYKIKLLHSNAGSDCGYPGLELLPDGNFVATTYIKYRPGAEKQSVVSTRFTLAATDKLAKLKAVEKPAASNATPSVAAQAHAPLGIVLDDDSAKLAGNWVVATKLPALVGGGYRHQNRQSTGEQTAKFTPEILVAGRYEVRLLYVAAGNRATNVAVTIHSADGAQTVFVNQRQECLIDGVPRALGTFAFEAGKKGSVVVSAANANGFVVVDGVQFVPADLAAGERATSADAGFPMNGERAKPSAKSAKPATRIKTEPIPPLPSATPGDVDGKSFDLVVVGGTPGGIACAVRAAREGLTVLLVNHTRHLGGFMTSGAGGWEAPSDALRSPLYAEMRNGAADYYRATYGEDSPEHRASLPDPKSNAHIARPKVEPRIAELLFNQMVGREKTLTVLLGFYPAAVEREGALLKSVTLRDMKTDRTCRVNAKIFADGMYEADLAAAAKVPCRVGREARSEYNEPHAGVIYSKERHKEAGQRGFPKDADEGRLKIRYNSHATDEIVAGPNSGEADKSVMAYNYRLVLTRDPGNRVMVSKPANYDPAIAKAAAGGGFVPNLPNKKVAWNGGRLIGPQNDYPEADWSTRERISRQYLDAMLMRLWFIQNEPAASADERARFAGYGLPADEFPDNDHVPYEIYVREARRIVGRHVFTEHDNVFASGLARTPVHPDSVAFTDWPLDSVACLPRKAPGGNTDGILFLAEQSRPAQVPYRSLLPQGVDNLLVPVALSASHVGWGAIRLEPVWMQTGEAAGFAAALAVKNQTTPGRLDSELLIRALVKSRVMVSFFNDVDVTSNEPWVPAVEYFGTKGFFTSYDAQAGEPLTASTAQHWAKTFAALVAKRPLDATTQALSLVKTEKTDAKPVSVAAVASLLKEALNAAGAKALAVDDALKLLALNEANNCTRGEACRLMFAVIERISAPR